MMLAATDDRTPQAGESPKLKTLLSGWRSHISQLLR